MMSIEEETEFLTNFLLHPCGFIVDVAGQLCIRPIFQMREYWEVSWNSEEEGSSCEFHKQFVNLEEAATFFVEKRRYLCLGLDFNNIAAEETDNAID